MMVRSATRQGLHRPAHATLRTPQTSSSIGTLAMIFAPPAMMAIAFIALLEL